VRVCIPTRMRLPRSQHKSMIGQIGCLGGTLRSHFAGHLLQIRASLPDRPEPSTYDYNSYWLVPMEL
jgi:hypothetical protein